MPTWLLLSYKIPREPTSARVSVWRKLRRLGALPVQDAVWVLPVNPRTREHFQWLADEIGQVGGDATIWESRPISDGHDEALIDRFRKAIEEQYRMILTELRRKDRDLAALSRRYREVLARDYFPAQLEGQVRAALLAARKEVTR